MFSHQKRRVYMWVCLVWNRLKPWPHQARSHSWCGNAIVLHLYISMGLTTPDAFALPHCSVALCFAECPKKPKINENAFLVWNRLTSSLILPAATATRPLGSPVQQMLSSIELAALFSVSSHPPWPRTIMLCFLAKAHQRRQMFFPGTIFKNEI